MTLHAVSSPEDVSGLPEYPIDADCRLDSHGFVQWEFRRWLSSDMRWNGTHECKSMWFELLNLAHSETPVGTLPSDLRRLARMIEPAVDRDHFAELCKLEHGPLHGWIRCRVDGEIRLMHPVVTRIVTAAFAARANHVARVEAASQKRRLQRLTEDVAALSPVIAGDMRKVKWIDAAIQERMKLHGRTRRIVDDLHTAIQACIEEDRRGRFPKIAQN
ncbi:hypothetical protein [Phaeobacter inhibens]|uniref:hypothetical protein n=1 Tax=Phaeobacter inhibens TaxID=221822 RepID=UPI0021A4B8BB|nr:hypothetical protein [Phaeobacter inhibens]UWR57198.1 hypothetical protein K4F89_01720 [Phaeobacter inhibens]